MPTSRMGIAALALLCAAALLPAGADAAFIRRSKLKQRPSVGYRVVVVVQDDNADNSIDTLDVTISSARGPAGRTNPSPVCPTSSPDGSTPTCRDAARGGGVVVTATRDADQGGGLDDDCDLRGSPTDVVFTADIDFARTTRISPIDKPYSMGVTALNADGEEVSLGLSGPSERNYGEVRVEIQLPPRPRASVSLRPGRVVSDGAQAFEVLLTVNNAPATDMGGSVLIHRVGDIVLQRPHTVDFSPADMDTQYVRGGGRTSTDRGWVRVSKKSGEIINIVAPSGTGELPFEATALANIEVDEEGTATATSDTYYVGLTDSPASS